MAKQPKLPDPIRRSIGVPWNQQTAFERFTAHFGEWWPRYSHSIGGNRVRQLVFECRVGGLLYEEHYDGTRMLWGTVTAFELWDPAKLGALAGYAAVALASGQITGTPGQTFTAGDMGSFTIGKDSVVVLGKPTVFDKSNIGQFNF